MRGSGSERERARERERERYIYIYIYICIYMSVRRNFLYNSFDAMDNLGGSYFFWGFGRWIQGKVSLLGGFSQNTVMATS